MKPRLRSAFRLAAALALVAAAARSAPVEVDLQLVLAVDVSGSMDRRELEIQREGYVAAIGDPLVVAAIEAGPTGRIALAFVEWAGPDFQSLTIPWRLIDGAGAARRFARELAAAPVVTGTDTSISRALLFSAALFDDPAYRADRRVIDLSGDGPNTAGPFVAPTRDRVVAAGITVNALPLLLDPAPAESAGEPALLRYFEDCVIGGAWAFSLPVRGIPELLTGIRRKLVLEVATAAPAARLVAARPAADCRLGQKEFYE